MQANDFRCQLDNKMIDQDVSGSHFPSEIAKHTHTQHNTLRKIALLELWQDAGYRMLGAGALG